MSELINYLIYSSGNITEPYSLVALCFFCVLIAFSLPGPLRLESQLENRLFWIFAILLIAFAALRPIGIARDDLAGYIRWVNQPCPFFECFKFIQSSRDWGWYFLVGLLKSLMSGERAIMAISAIGVFIQMFIINKLCRQKLLALTLYIPLTYIYFDFTLLRAGSALTLFYIGIYLLIHLRKILGSSALLGNYLFHSQGIFSIGVIPFSWVAKYKYISIAVMLGAVACIYLQWTPSGDQLSFLDRAGSQHYWGQYRQGLFLNEKPFPITNLLIIGYLVFVLLVEKTPPDTNVLRIYALASILLAIFLAWFFAPIHAIQTRLFDFYIAPLVFIVGDLKPNRYTRFATLSLAFLLYIRIELIHNWIMG